MLDNHLTPDAVAELRDRIGGARQEIHDGDIKRYFSFLDEDLELCQVDVGTKIKMGAGPGTECLEVLLAGPRLQVNRTHLTPPGGHAKILDRRDAISLQYGSGRIVNP